MYRLLKISLLAFVMTVAGMSQAEEVTRAQMKGLDEQVQDIKKDVLDISSQLLRLEEKLLYPSNTQVSLFVSIPKDSKFRLDSIQLKLDNKLVAQHLYKFRELEALQKGGVQRIYTGNLRTGQHVLAVTYSGKEQGGSAEKRSATYTVSKAVGPKFVEIKLAGTGNSAQDIQFKDW